MKVNWYIIYVKSGYEKEVVKFIKSNALSNNLSKYFFDFVIPVSENFTLKAKIRNNKEKKIFPGYILLRVHLNTLTFNLIRSTQYVSRLLGYNNPLPIPDREINLFLHYIKSDKFVKNACNDYLIGDKIIIRKGPFESLTGQIKEIKLNKKMVRVSVPILGTHTILDLDYDQIKKK